MRLGLAIALGALLGACGAGDGSLLDEDGRSPEAPWVPALGSRYGEATFEPSFQGVSTGFLQKFCTECHQGASAPKGLDLSGEEAFERLVGKRSSERPDLLLVDPGAPEKSYLVMKLEGAARIAGQRMPRNRPARPPGELETIKAWIQAGAPRD